MREKGIFLTFMAFLLVGTVLALNISVNQSEIEQKQNLVKEIAFRNTNNRFNNIIQQIAVVKEGYAGNAYSRFMPFEKFTTGDNWIRIEQTLPVDETFLEKTYDTLNLFAVFAEEKGAEGTEIAVHDALQNTAWGGSENYPEISYIVLPQCLKISIGNEDSIGIPKFESGSIAGGDPCDFDETSIESHEIEIHFDADNFQLLQCGGVFSPCGENGYPEEEYYTEITLVLDNCNYGPTGGFDEEGKQTISGNLNGMSGNYIDAVFASTQNFKLEFDNYQIKITKTNDETELFYSKIIFKEPIEEIVLAPGSFDFSVKNPNFEICRATEEEGCD